MKKLVATLVWGLLMNNMTNAQDTTLTSPSAWQPAAWVAKSFARGVVPPFSFVYGGKNSGEFITGWKHEALTVSTAADKDVTLFTYTDPQTALAVKCEVTAFKDFPAVEWVLKFENTSAQKTPLLEKVKALDREFVTGSGELILHHSRGSDAKRNDFEPLSDSVVEGKNFYLTPDRGRSSDGAALPFFNIEAPGGQGFIVAVGWTGKWFADVQRPSATACSLSAGMERMKLALRPGEEIRTPRIALLHWRGERMTGHNQFRRFVQAHHARKIDGRRADYPLCSMLDYGDPPPCNEFEALTEKYGVGLIERYHYFGLTPEVVWIDAGWYDGCGFKLNGGGKWYDNVGNWAVPRERFPNGLRAMSDEARATGAKFLLWFEPERVRSGTLFDREHPEWMIKLSHNGNTFLFDLGNPAALKWLVDFMTEFFRREGIDHYRQDFNFDPYPFWEKKDAADGEDRVGMAEIRHIEGLYAYWDALLERFPNLLIDNCASGGRRIDLETVSRSAPLWRTDYQYGEPKGQQCHTYGLHFYLPQHGTATYSSEHYLLRSALGATMATAWEVSTGKGTRPIPEMQHALAEFKELRPYYYGDYYPLTPVDNYAGDDVWLAYQLNRPEQRDGIVVAFRREQNKTAALTVKLSGLADGDTYELFDEDKNIREKKTGRELAAGIELVIEKTPGSLLIRYQAVK